MKSAPEFHLTQNGGVAGEKCDKQSPQKKTIFIATARCFFDIFFLTFIVINF